jgi:sugar phosphate permease
MIERVTGWAIFVWLLTLVSYAVAILNRNSFSALGPTAQEYFSVDATVLGTFAVMQLLLYTAMQIPVGILVGRFGPTRIILFGAVLMVAGQVLLATAEQVWMVVLARILVGIGDAGTFVSVLRIIAFWFPARQFPVWTQLTSQFGQLGQIVAVIPLALLVSTQGWVTGFLSVAALTLLVAVAVFAFVSDNPDRKSLAASLIRREHADAQQDAASRGSLMSEIGAQLRGIPQIWSLPGVRLAFWVHFTPPFSTGAFLMLWGYPFLTGGLGFSRADASALITMSVILGIIFGVLIGPIVVRFSAQRVWMVITVIVLIMLAWTAVLLWPGAPPTWVVIVLLIVLSLGFPMSMISFDILRTYGPVRLISVATGFTNTGGFIAAIVAIFLIGVALDLQDAGTPATYNLTAFKLAMTTQFLVWGVGLWQIIRNLRLTLRANRQAEDSSSR